MKTLQTFGTTTSKIHQSLSFEFQFKNASPDNNQIQFQIGSRAAQSKFTDACYFAGYDHAVPTKYAYSTKADGGVLGRWRP